MEEKKTSLRLVYKLPSKEKKAAAEVNAQKEIQSLGSSSPDPIVSADNMDKLQKGSKDSVKESRSPRFRIILRLKPKNDQEKQSRVEKVSQEPNNDQEQQPRIEKVSNETRGDEEDQKIIEDRENQDDGRKRGGLDEELSKNFRPDEAEEKRKRKRRRGFTLALSREQIDEDIVELLGPKASRKRAKKKGYMASGHQLNHLVPAAWMETLIDY